MHTNFDHVATCYDDNFSNSIIGKAQRKLVWEYLEKIMANQEGLKI